MNSIKNREEFDNLCKYENKIYFKFTASWCKPCQIIQPTLLELSKDYMICSIDIDEFSDIADEFNIDSIPTILRFDKGVCHKYRCSGGSINKVLEYFST